MQQRSGLAAKKSLDKSSSGENVVSEKGYSKSTSGGVGGAGKRDSPDRSPVRRSVRQAISNPASSPVESLVKQFEIIT